MNADDPRRTYRRHSILVVACLAAAACGGKSHAPAADAGVDAASCPCPDDGISCTVDACLDGVCAHTPDDSLCDAEPCEVASCDLDVQGCVRVPAQEGSVCGPNAPYGGPPPTCRDSSCTPGRLVGIDFGYEMQLDDHPAFIADDYTALLARAHDSTGDGIDEVAVLVVPGRSDLAAGFEAVLALYDVVGSRRLWSRAVAVGEPTFFSGLVASGNLDDDGVEDFVVTEHAEGGPALATAVDGSLGNELWSRDLGLRTASLSVYADADHDGTPDVMVAGQSATGSGLGELKILSGVDGHAIGHRSAESPEEATSFRKAAPGPDLTGDGLPEIFVGAARGLDRTSVVRMLDSRDLTPQAVLEREGASVGVFGSLGDVNGDTLPDLMVGVYPTGVDQILDNAIDPTNLEPLWAFEYFNFPPQMTVDSDGDDSPDLMGLAYLTVEGRRFRALVVLSGIDGTVVMIVEPQDEDGAPLRPGSAVLPFGDVNGDGADDWVTADALTGDRLWVFYSRIAWRPR